LHFCLLHLFFDKIVYTRNNCLLVLFSFWNPLLNFTFWMYLWHNWCDINLTLLAWHRTLCSAHWTLSDWRTNKLNNLLFSSHLQRMYPKNIFTRILPS
jgi:hypothetical protein